MTYRQFTQKQKQWIRHLLSSGQKEVNALDVLKQNWPAGQLEVSTFQQKLVVFLEEGEAGEMDAIIIHMLEVCDLFRQMDHEGLISSWITLPNEDNTEWIGEKKDEATAHFLPDMGVAAEMLNWLGKNIQIKEELFVLARRNFKDPVEYRLTLNHRIILPTFALMIVLLVAGGYVVSELNNKVNDLEAGIELKSQKDQEDLDVLNKRIENLYDLNYRMSLDSQQLVALKVVGDAVDRSALQIIRSTKELQERVNENRSLLKSNDSLLRKLSVE